MGLSVILGWGMNCSILHTLPPAAFDSQEESSVKTHLTYFAGEYWPSLRLALWSQDLKSEQKDTVTQAEFPDGPECNHGAQTGSLSNQKFALYPEQKSHKLLIAILEFN